MPKWTISDIPSQTGRLAIVTGTGGLGYETALALSQRGAEVVIAGRNAAKGRAAIEKIKGISPRARVRFGLLDLADLASVAEFGSRTRKENRAIDILVNNAAVMATPKRGVTADGFELQFGTNFLGHFALTMQLLPMLRQSRSPRVVQVSSGAHRIGAIHLDDLQSEKSYSPWGAYAQSKLAMLMFALELQRRSDREGWGLMSNAAHPGYSRTDLIANGPGVDSFMARVSGLIRPFMSQTAAAGALPTLFAATSPDAVGGGYYGPDGLGEMKGWPSKAVIGTKALDRKVASQLWDISETLTGALVHAQ